MTGERREEEGEEDEGGKYLKKGSGRTRGYVVVIDRGMVIGPLLPRSVSVRG